MVGDFECAQDRETEAAAELAVGLPLPTSFATAHD